MDYFAYLINITTNSLQPLISTINLNTKQIQQTIECSIEDIDRLIVHQHNRYIPGAWIYKLGSSNVNQVATWTRRFAVLKGSYLFFFHNSNSKKPLFVLVLTTKTKAIKPINDKKSFDDEISNKAFKSNEGYEFEIQNVNSDNIVSTFRFYCVSLKERDEWVESCNINAQLTSINEPNILVDGDIVVTSTQLFHPSQHAIENTNTNYFTSDDFKEEMNDKADNEVDHLNDKESENNNADDRYDDGQYFNADSLKNIMFTKEARQREAHARELMNSLEYIKSLREDEEKNPMSLSKLFRTMLFFCKEELVSFPTTNATNTTSSQDFICLKGEYAENLIITIYQYYCNDIGLMSLENFVEFLDDSGVLQTHATRDSNDEPTEEYMQKLAPTMLIQTMKTKTKLIDTSTMTPSIFEDDEYTINFPQFFVILQYISEIVYEDIYKQSKVKAMNKFLLVSE